MRYKTAARSGRRDRPGKRARMSVKTFDRGWEGVDGLRREEMEG